MRVGQGLLYGSLVFTLFGSYPGGYISTCCPEGYWIAGIDLFSEHGDTRRRDRWLAYPILSWPRISTYPA